MTKNARAMLVDTTRHANILWQKLLDAPLPRADGDWTEANTLIYASTYAFAAVRALKALAEIDPARADAVAVEIDGALQDGELAWEWLQEHGQQLGVLDADGAVIPRGES